MTSSRSQVSRGDSAPASTECQRATGAPDVAMALVAFGEQFDVGGLESGGRANASMAATALPRGYRQARSKAVRAGVVDGHACRSAGSRRQLRDPDQVWIPVGGRRCAYSKLCGAFASIHFAPWRAAADCPATTPRRLDHSQAAYARCTGGEIGVERQIDVRMERDESASQPVTGQCTRCERFAADERFSHAASVSRQVRQPRRMCSEGDNRRKFGRTTRSP